MCTVPRIPASAQRGSSVAILWSCGFDCGELRRMQQSGLSRSAAMLAASSGVRPLLHNLADNLQKRLCLGPQGTMPGMDDVQAAVERLGVPQFDGHQLATANLGRDRHRRQKCHAEATFYHSFRRLDGIYLHGDIWDQRGMAEQTSGERPIARSTLIKNQWPGGDLAQASTS